MIRTTIILTLVLATASYAGETIIIPETASTLFVSQVLAASTPVTSSSTYTLERTRKVSIEYKLGAPVNNGDTLAISPLYTGNSLGNGTGYALPKKPTDTVTLSMGDAVSGFIEIEPPSGTYSMTLMVNSTFANTIDVTARGK